MNNSFLNNVSENVRTFLNYMEDPLTRDPVRVPDSDNRSTALVRDGRQHQITNHAPDASFMIAFPYYGPAFWKTAAVGASTLAERHTYSLCTLFFNASGQAIATTAEKALEENRS